MYPYAGHLSRELVLGGLAEQSKNVSKIFRSGGMPPRRAGRGPATATAPSPHLPLIQYATILRFQATILTTAARYRSSASFVKIVSPTFLLRPFCFAATMSTSAELSTSLQVKKLSPSATIPTRGSPLSAGFDLSANEKKVCKTHARSLLFLSTLGFCAFEVALATSYLFDT